MLESEIDARFPSDHADQIDAYFYLASYQPPRPTIDFLDLGAGTGGSFDRVRKVIPGVNWTGLDIEDSPTVRKRKRTDLKFLTYDGVNIPLANASVDFVFSRQVFEHVRFVEPLLKEIARVLRSDGIFAGSVSQLEPFHARSMGSYTYYGFATMAKDAGLDLVEFRPGVDGFTLILRNFIKYQMRADVKAFDSWLAGESPLNAFLGNQMSGKPLAEINKAKVRYCGHLCFKFAKANGG